MVDVDTDPQSRRAQRHGRSSRIFLALGIVAVLALGAGAVVVVTDPGSDSGPARHATAAAPKVSDGFTEDVTTGTGAFPLRGAVGRGQPVPVFAKPDASAGPVTTLSAVTDLAAPRSFLAFDQYHDWLHVYLPIRPNSSTGWIRVADVTVSKLDAEIRVSLSQHTLWLVRNGTVEITTPAAIGMPGFPTPTGTFFFTDPVDLHAYPTTAYGVFAIGLSSHPDGFTEFGGGDAQIAIHGTNDPGGIGQEISHGCIRVYNDVIEVLSKLPLGTPVYVTA